MTRKVLLFTCQSQDLGLPTGHGVCQKYSLCWSTKGEDMRFFSAQSLQIYRLMRGKSTRTTCMSKIAQRSLIVYGDKHFSKEAYGTSNTPARSRRLAFLSAALTVTARGGCWVMQDVLREARHQTPDHQALQHHELYWSSRGSWCIPSNSSASSQSRSSSISPWDTGVSISGVFHPTLGSS